MLESKLRGALKEQYHAGLSMLMECVDKCPDTLWFEVSSPRDSWRPFWRIAFHVAFYTHLYLGQNEDSFVPWPARKPNIHHGLWEQPFDVEPYELPTDTPTYTKIEIRDYIGFVDTLIDNTVDGLDLDSDYSGFPWYKNIDKLSHQLMNLRHLQGHIGQLSELLMERGIDTNWISQA